MKHCRRKLHVQMHTTQQPQAAARVSCCKHAGGTPASQASCNCSVLMLTILFDIYYFATLSTSPAEAVSIQLQTASGLHGHEMQEV
jgi:hypothetical protein